MLRGTWEGEATSEEAGGKTTISPLFLLEVDSGDSPKETRQTTDGESNPRPGKEGLIPPDTPALPSGLDGRGLGTEVAQLACQENTMDAVIRHRRSRGPRDVHRLLIIESSPTDWKKC